jgi:hypothetical protein
MDREYKYGVTGFVKLQNNIASKYIEIKDMYWIREYITLLKLWPYNHPSITQFKSVSFINSNHPNGGEIIPYLKLDYKRYSGVLSDFRFSNDVEIIQCIYDLFSSISLCHKLGIWHRDIKPDNIGIDNGRVILLDFSHALYKTIQNIYLDKQVLTYSYRAPEVYRYQNIPDTKKIYNAYNEKVDIWSIGVILYEIYTGKSLVDLAKKHNTLHKFTKSKDDEIILGKFLQIPIFTKLLKESIKTNSKYKYSQTYERWIMILLTVDHMKRPSAFDFLSVVKSFASYKNIPIIETEYRNETYVFNVKLIKHVSPLLMDCMNFVNKLNIKINKKCFGRIVQYLLNRKIITRNNYRTMIIACILCISTIIYDDIIEVNQCDTLINHKVNEMEICKCICSLSEYFHIIILNYKWFM